MRAFPDLQFYDYTKWPLRLRGERPGDPLPPNYQLTFALSENNVALVRQALCRGANIATVSSVPKGRPLPERFMSRAVIDGDLHDLRFLDPAGDVVGLRSKGRGKKDTSGFVRPAEEMARGEGLLVQ